MRTTLTVLVVGALIWLLFLHSQHNNLKEQVDHNTNEIHKLNGEYETLKPDLVDENGNVIENNPNNNGNFDVNNPLESLDKAEDKFDEQVQMPYENPKTNQNTDIKKNDEAQKVGFSVNNKDNVTNEEDEESSKDDSEKDSKSNSEDKDKHKRVENDVQKVAVAFYQANDNIELSNAETFVQAFQYGKTLDKNDYSYSIVK